MEHALESLIHPRSRSDFFDHYKRHVPLVIHGPGETTRELTALPFLESLDALLAAWPHHVDAYRPGVADEANSIAIPADQARQHFTQGAGLLFNDVQRISPVLENWLASLRSDLGLASLTYARSLVYAIPAETGTTPHFDPNINLVLQVQGTKKWQVAPNEHVAHPMTRHTIGLPTDSELGGYAYRPMPDRLPHGAAEFVLEPGSVLFVPRGAWHETEALSDALSLTFTFGAPTWIDLVTEALRHRLASSSEWRETADFVTDSERAHEAAEKLDALLGALVRDLRDWNAADILEETEGDTPGSSTDGR